MKHVSTLMFICLCALVTKAQVCNYMPFKQGHKFSYAMYDAKDKPAGTVNYTVTNARTEGEDMFADVDIEVKDEKGKDVTKSKAKYRCNAGKFYVDMSQMGGAQMEAYKDMEMKGDASYLEFPAELTANTTLPDGTMHLDMFNNGQPFGTMDMNVTERKVEAQESVTTPAGTFDAFRIRSKSNTKVSTMGIGIPVEVTSVEWYAKNVGMVKQESYNKNGKKQSSMVLSALSQ